MTDEFDLTLADGHRLHVYDTGEPDGGAELAVFWHHGTPNIGAPPTPLFRASGRLGIRWVSVDRPGYGSSTPATDRTIGSVAALVERVADHLEIERFAVMGHSGGGPHALACAALLPDRVVGAVGIASLAPYGSEGLDYFAGMAPSGAASLRASAAGRVEKERYEASGPDFDPEFTDGDMAALRGDWSWIGEVVGPAVAQGTDGLIADDLAYVAPWGFDPTAITTPTLLVHGGADRVVPPTHSEWLARHCPAMQLRLSPGDGHLSVLRHGTAALEWLVAID
ncbi:MAG TPA: alpha/beta fold hydrolase [Ilumatobacteraceae bacterium]|nr:alpha/beta fold hydrolase [Ilumatobacteraceae bacterium]HRB03360.1 alpha/beta fold hydrolase [Ilumatobacteraceae bacterium]